MSLQLMGVGKRHCRVLISGNINSDATGNNITFVTSVTKSVTKVPDSARSPIATKNPTLTADLNLSMSGPNSTIYQQKFRAFCRKLVLSKLEFLDLIVGGWKSATNTGRQTTQYIQYRLARMSVLTRGCH